MEGNGAGYQYPHDFQGHHVAQQYLPDKLRGHRYYQPSDSGREGAMAEAWRRRRGQPPTGGDQPDPPGDRG